MDKLQMKIDGMTCGHCVGTVKQALTKLDGVTITSLSVGRAEVAYDPAKADVPSILAAVDGAGYPARAADRAS